MKPRTPPKVKAQPKPVSLTPEEIALVRSLVIYEDADIMALNKPSGLSSQGGRGQVNTLDELLWAFAKPCKARPRLIHRLDRDTSGVILTAKTKPAASFLGKHMMGRRFAKTYRAIVTPGAPEPAGGVIEAALRREEAGREAYMRVCPPDHPDAETALTRYRTLAKGAGAALVEANPQTGRMHQIRVHGLDRTADRRRCALRRGADGRRPPGAAADAACRGAELSASRRWDEDNHRGYPG